VNKVPVPLKELRSAADLWGIKHMFVKGVHTVVCRNLFPRADTIRFMTGGT